MSPPAGRRTGVLRAPATLWTLLGLLALFAGLAWLLGIFAAERIAARVQIDQRARTLENFAHLSLTRGTEYMLRNREPSIDAAEAWPLSASAGLARWRDGERVVPPPPPQGPSLDLAAHFEDFRRSAPRAVAGAGLDDPQVERERLRAAIFAGLAARDALAVADTLRAFLAHRARFVLPVTEDLPATLAVVEGLAEAEGYAKETLARVLHEGVEDRHGRRLEGLQPLLIRRQAAFAPVDLAFLGARIVAVSRRVGAPTGPFEARLDEALHPTALPKGYPYPVDAVSEGWLQGVQPRGSTDAFRFDVADELRITARQLRLRGLLRDGEDLSLDSLAELQEIFHLQIRCDGPAFVAARAAADAAFLWKTALLALTAVFAVLAALLGLSAGRRRQRYLDLKTEFVSTVSHELRTPLASVRALAETLERRLDGESRARDYPRRMVRAIDGLTALVENILSFNRLEQDRVKPRLERVALDDLLSTVAEEVAEQAPRAVDWQVTGLRGVVLQADPALLLLVVSNLCRNAWKYNARDPIALRVHVAATPARRAGRPSGLRVEVHDNGQGVPAVAIPHLFTAFYRAPGTSDRRGSGLGLALCQRAVEAHGGRIALARTSPEGSVFAVDLPPEAVAGDLHAPEVPEEQGE